MIYQEKIAPPPSPIPLTDDEQRVIAETIERRSLG
jgi:hypothetical protein